MDTKKKLNKLIVYKTHLEDRLSSPIPTKHTSHPDTYKRFLKNEIDQVNSKIESLKGL